MRANKSVRTQVNTRFKGFKLRCATLVLFQPCSRSVDDVPLRGISLIKICFLNYKMLFSLLDVNADGVDSQALLL